MKKIEKAIRALPLMGSKILPVRRPLIVGWAITGRCNEQCPSCSIWQRIPDELGTEQCLNLIDQMRACGTIAVSLTGGEPLLREDLPAIVRRASGHDMLVKLNTNGILLGERLNEIVGLSQIAVSLEGLADIHDRIRHRSTFDKVISAIDAARARGLHVVASATINSLNAERIGEVVTLCSELRLPVGFQPSVHLQLGSGLDNSLSPSRPAYTRAIDELIARKRSDARRIIINSPAGLRHLRRWPDPTEIKCAGGLVSCRIDALGNVFPCGRCRVPRAGMNAAEVGLQAAFDSIGKVTCADCWCANRLEFNLFYALNPSAVANVVRQKLFNGR